MKKQSTVVIATSLALLLLMSRGSAAQALVDFAMAYIATAEKVESYCEATSPGTGKAIHEALTEIRRGKDDYLQWMVEQPGYSNAQQAAQEMITAPSEYARHYGSQISCQGLAGILKDLSGPLATEISSDAFKRRRSQILRTTYMLVPPPKTVSAQVEAWGCLDQADGARALTPDEKKLFEGRPTDNFITNGQPNFGPKGYPIAHGGAKPDESTTLSDWYVLCLLKRGSLGMGIRLAARSETRAIGMH
jgi:hypothetical protein